MMANGLTFVAIHLALFLAIQAVTCLSDSERSHWCATPDPSAEDMQRVEHASRQFMEKFMPAPRTASPQSKPTPQPSLQPIPLPTPTSAPSTLPGSGEEGDGTTISVYFHVIYSSTGQGDPSDDAIASQIDILNSNFDGTGFTFSLAATDRHENDFWYAMTPNSEAELEAKRALVDAGPGNLNIYTIGPGASGGWSTYPWGYPGNEWKDGIVIVYNTLPGYGGSGVILTHECGHWLGLYHTFQGGCSGEGDFVSDTPAEASPSYACDLDRDTCPDDPGLDPVQNFMDYSTCRIEFTPMQGQRINIQWSMYRDTTPADD